jgi:hypothetical protein
MSTMTRKKRRVRRAFRRWASIVFWTSPLWSFPAAFAAMYKGLLPGEPVPVLILFVGVIPAIVWCAIRLIGFIAVKVTKDEHRHYERLSKPLEIRPDADALYDDSGEAQADNEGPPPASAAIN